MTISLITVTYNAAGTLERCIRSVLSQRYKEVQYIIIDGGSSDQTLSIIDRYKNRIDVFVSEPDAGIYDAMNKGIKLATGDIVGVLNADDYFADDLVMSSIAQAFADPETEAIYGNLDYVGPDGRIVREWRSKLYRPGLFNWGWMPPHPTFYCRSSVFDRLGYYDLSYGTAADYELMLRFINRYHLCPRYLEMTMVRMNVGGVSNRTIGNRVKAWRSDHRAMITHGVKLPALALMLKPLRKIWQFWVK